MAVFEFNVTLRGEGSDADEAWANAVDGFSNDPGDPDTSTEVIGD